MKKLSILVAALMLLGLSGALMAQSHNVNITISAISLIDVSNPSTAVTFSIGAPAQAGLAPVVTGSPNNDKQVYYTSLVGSGLTREVQATFASLPAGLNLNVALAAPTGGAGTRGTGSNADFTSASLGPKDVITGVGSCYSSRTAGAAVTYTLTAPDASLANLATQAATNHQITYTLTAAH
jgi:hypothetical protein